MTETVGILAKLVAFDTTSSKSNLELMEYVQAYLDGAGATVRRVYDPYGRKAALHAVIGIPVLGASRSPATSTPSRSTVSPGPPTPSAYQKTAAT